MFNRTAIMRTAWSQYRREHGTARFDRAAFASILRQRWAFARLLDCRAIMVRAWARYRAAYGTRPFLRWAFRGALRIEWAEVRFAVKQAAEQARRAALAAMPKPIVLPLPERALSPMEAALDAVKYLPAHMSAARAEAAIRARFAAHA